MANENTAAPASQETVETQETVQPGQESSQQSPAIAEAKVAEQKYLKSLRLKVDGQEFDEDLPFELPDVPEAKEWMTRQLQLGKMGQKRAQDYSTLEKEVGKFLDLLKTNPKKALQNPNIGVDMKKLVAEFLDEEISNSQKSPEQLEREKLQEELQALKEERKNEKEASDKREVERLTDLEFQKYDTLIDKALDTHKDLPKSPYVVKKIAEYTLLALQNNIDVPIESIVPLVKEDIQSEIKDMFSAMPDEVIEAFLGKDRMSKMRKQSINKGKAATPPTTRSIKDVGQTTKKEAAKEGKPMTYKEFFKL